MRTCLYCDTPITSRHAQKFCSQSCSSSFNNKLRIVSDETKEKIRVGVISQIKSRPPQPKKIHAHVCNKCGSDFMTEKKLRKGRLIHCVNCRRKPQRFLKNASSILELSKRTTAKILKRAKINCVMCGWDKTTLDIHHVIPSSKGGPDTHDNLIAVCPNCHRLSHEGSYEKEILLQRTLDKTFADWKDYYNIISSISGRPSSKTSSLVLG